MLVQVGLEGERSGFMYSLLFVICFVCVVNYIQFEMRNERENYNGSMTKSTTAAVVMRGGGGEDDDHHVVDNGEYSDGCPLPEDQVFEVLTRVPLDDLATCRGVSSQWRWLTYEWGFARLHCRRAGAVSGYIVQSVRC